MIDASTIAPIATAIPQGHDVRREPLSGQRKKRENDRDREREDGNERAPEVIEEEHDDRAHDEHFLDQLVPERGHGAMDQLRAVVRDHQLDSRREGASDLFQPPLDAVDHPQRVLLLPHDDDAADDFAVPVQLDDATPLLGAQMHFAEATKRDRDASGAHLDGDRFEIGRASCRERV